MLCDLGPFVAGLLTPLLLCAPRLPATVIRLLSRLVLAYRDVDSVVRMFCVL